MKKLSAVIAGLVAALSLSVVSTAGAVPSFEGMLNPKAQGNLYKEVLKPVTLDLEVKTTPAPGDATLLPQIQTRTQFPDEMNFYPDPKMPVCKAEDPADPSTIGAQGYLAESEPPDVARARCPDSIIGNGSSTLYLAQIVSPATFVTDPIMTVFNNGTDSNGNGQIIISAYSFTTGAGILIGGSIDSNGVLSIDVPRLTADSSVPSYVLSIPGDIGQDPNYVRSTCKTGSWIDKESILLGKRSDTGVVSDELELFGSQNTTPCTGLAGKGKLKVTKVKAKGKVKANKKGKFKVTVKNNGTATAKKVKLTGKGAAKGSNGIGNLAPGKSKTYTKKFKVKGKKGKKVTVKIQAKGKNTNSSVGKTKVKLK